MTPDEALNDLKAKCLDRLEMRRDHSARRLSMDSPLVNKQRWAADEAVIKAADMWAKMETAPPEDD